MPPDWLRNQTLPSTSGSFPSPPIRTAFTFQTPGLKSLFNDFSSASFFSLSLQLMHHSFSTRTDKQYFALTNEHKMYFFSSKYNSITQTDFHLVIIFQEMKQVNAICVTKLCTTIFKMNESEWIVWSCEWKLEIPVSPATSELWVRPSRLLF